MMHKALWLWYINGWNLVGMYVVLEVMWPIGCGKVKNAEYIQVQPHEVQLSFTIFVVPGYDVYHLQVHRNPENCHIFYL